MTRPATPSPPRWRRRWIGACLWLRRWGLPLLLLLVVAAEAWARLGGGQSYSGGSSGGGSRGGSSGGDAEVLFLLVRLAFFYPEIGVPLLLIVGGVYVFGDLKGMVGYAISGERADPYQSAAGWGASPMRNQTTFGALKDLDPGFSRVVFVDFVNALYSRFHAARGHREFGALRPFLSDLLYQQAASEQSHVVAGGLPKVDRVEEIVIGSIVPVSVNQSGGTQTVRLRIKANYVEHVGPHVNPYYVEEIWTFERPEGALSPKPEQARTLGCPSCGSPVELTAEGVCTYCDEPVAAEPVGWQLKALISAVREPRQELALAGGGVEAGTLAPTVFQPDLAANRRRLVDRHPDFSFSEFEKRVERTFLELQAAWTAQDESRLRPHETDFLFQAHRFWLERYREQGWQNLLEDVQVQRIEVARIDLDAHYESIAVRIHASMKDSTVDRSGTVISGSRDQPRRFSEYWTLARTIAAAGRAEKPAGSCPSCGAPLDDVNQAGVCGYCDSKIVTGEFGWVLALIEQDEEYAG